jgi:protein SCO1/2
MSALLKFVYREDAKSVKKIYYECFLRVLRAFAVFFILAPHSTNAQDIQTEIRNSYLQQNIGAQIPGEAIFKDDGDSTVQLKDYLGRVPSLLVLGYFTCPDLCPMTFRHLTEELNGIAPVAGRDFQVIIVSFDPRDTPEISVLQKQSCLRAYKWPKESEGWHFLTGQPDSIGAVAKAVGFHYTFDQKQGRFVHPTGVMVLTPSGRLSHYFFGVDASPADMEAAINDAAADRQSAVDQPDQQYCVDYDPTLTHRGKWISRALNAGCVVWAGILFGYIGYKILGDVRQRGAREVRS